MGIGGGPSEDSSLCPANQPDNLNAWPGNAEEEEVFIVLSGSLEIAVDCGPVCLSVCLCLSLSLSLSLSVS